MEVHAAGTHGEPQQSGDLGVPASGQVMQQEHLPLRLGEVSQRLQQQRAQQGISGGARRGQGVLEAVEGAAVRTRAAR